MYHTTMGFPATSIWYKTINAGYFEGLPGVTTKCMCHYIKVVDET